MHVYPTATDPTLSAAWYGKRKIHNGHQKIMLQLPAMQKNLQFNSLPYHIIKLYKNPKTFPLLHFVT